MAGIRIIKGYLAAAAGGVGNFEVLWDSGANSLSIAGGGSASFSGISRFDFFDFSGNLLAVIPCVPDVSSFSLTGSISAKFQLGLNSLIGAPPGLAVAGTLLAASGSLGFVFGPGGTRNLKIGGTVVLPASQPEDDFSFEFVDTLQGLAMTGIQKPGTFQSQGTPWIETPQIGLNRGDATPFGICCREFNSANITCHVRNLDTGSGILPVLTIRRQLCSLPTENQTAPFQLPQPIGLSIPTDGKGNSNVHAAQFPTIHWLTAPPSADGSYPAAQQWHVELSGFQGATINQFWTQSVVAPYLTGLAAVNDALPISFLPSFQLSPTATAAQDFFWRLCISVQQPAGPGTALTHLSTRLVPGGILAPEIPIPSSYLPAIVLDSFRTHDGTGLAFTGALGLTDGNGAQITGTAWYTQYVKGDSNELQFSLAVQPFEESLVRLGALDLSLGNAVGSPVVSHKLDVIVTFDTLSLHRNFNLGAPADFAWFPRVYITGSLPAFRYVPAGEDGLPQTASDAILNDDDVPAGTIVVPNAANFQRDQPIVIDLSNSTGQAQDQAQNIVLTESSRVSAVLPHSQKLIVRLNAASGSAQPGAVMIIDRQQFLVARVEFKPDSGDAGEEVGVWCNLFPEGPTWRISRGAQGFKLQLPPQSLGEEMEQITNPPLLEGRTLQYRFSPSLSANLLASYNPQNYVQPAWDLRSVLGYAQERAPGASVDPSSGIAFNLLYDLTTTVTQPNLRLSEMFARLGDFPGPMPAGPELSRIHPEFSSAQVTAVATMASRWSNRYRQLLSRPAVLELWDDHQGADLLLDDGVTCQVRTDVLYNPDALPAPAGTPPVIRGGIGLGLETPNLVDELLRNPKSVSAHLASPRFSALGGWGNQKASFAKGKIIVESHTYMGRLSTLSITLVGRIGVYWNRALHVTVYERSVLPSRQFYGEQEPLRGRPILRKVKEYVKIMEPDRTYPESGALPLTRGFVQATHFKSITINVDSVWGGDVGKSGWHVPLWRPDAVPADIYPRPNITLGVLVDPAVGVDQMHAEILDPQKLCFYTDTSDDTTDDTDSWTSVLNIDFTDAARVRTINHPPTGKVGILGPVDPSVEPGFGRFSYHVAPIAGQTNLVAERTAKAIGASLANVSMMRGSPSATAVLADAADPNQAVGRVRDWWTATVHQLGQVPSSAGDAKAQVASILKNGFAAQLGNDLSLVSGKLSQSCQAISNRLMSGLGKFTSITEGLLTEALESFSTRLKTTLNSLAGQAGTTAQQLEDFVNETYDALLGTLAPFTQGITDAQTTLKTVCSDVTTQLKATQALLVVTNADLSDAVAQVQDQIASYTNTMTAVCSAVVGNSGNSLAVAMNYQLTADLAGLASMAATAGSDVTALLASVNLELSALIQSIAAKEADCTAAAAALGQVELQAEVDLLAMRDSLLTLIANTTAHLDTALLTFYGQYQILSDDVAAQQKQIDQWIATRFANLDATAKSLCDSFTLDLASIARGLTAELQGAVTDALSSVVGDAASYGPALAAVEQQVAGQLAGICQQAVANLPAPPLPTFILPDSSLQLLRAFGDPPQVPSLDFNVAGVATPLAYFYDATGLPVLMTAAETTIQQAAQGLAGLSQFNLSMPATGLLDRVLPPDLTSFDISRIFPSFAGLNLSGLLQGVTLPDAANQNIRIAHQIDPQTLRASLDADIAFPLAGSNTIFDIGPVNLTLVDANLEAHVHVQSGVGQQTTQTSNGSINGQWELSVGGMSLIALIDTTLSFDESGSLHFSISPANVQLAQVLQFLTDLIDAFDFGDSGFSLNILPDPKVQCILDLPLPDMGGGAFAIMNLRLGALFEIGVDAGGFYVTVGANLGRQVAPFDLTIFILGGAGWFECDVTYRFGQALTGTISVGMAASASLDIALGPISGSVAIYFGIFAVMQIGPTGGLQLGIMILFTGQVSLLGLIDLSISLLLEAEYQSGGGLTGRGVVSVSIKICWCFTLNVNESVQYTFGSSGQKSVSTQKAEAAAIAAPPAPDYTASALNYVNMLA